MRAAPGVALAARWAQDAPSLRRPLKSRGVAYLETLAGARGLVLVEARPRRAARPEPPVASPDGAIYARGAVALASMRPSAMPAYCRALASALPSAVRIRTIAKWPPRSKATIAPSPSARFEPATPASSFAW